MFLFYQLDISGKSYISTITRLITSYIKCRCIGSRVKCIPKKGSITQGKMVQLQKHLQCNQIGFFYVFDNINWLCFIFIYCAKIFFKLFFIIFRANSLIFQIAHLIYFKFCSTLLCIDLRKKNHFISVVLVLECFFTLTLEHGRRKRNSVQKCLHEVHTKA